MDPSHWTHILTLLAITVIVDGKIYKEEVDTFVAESVRLKESLSPDMIFSEKMVFDWFVVHRDEIAKWLKDPESHTQVLRHILALGENPDREGILDAMYAIAIADAAYHKTESDTLTLAAKHWNLPHPHKEETD